MTAPPVPPWSARDVIRATAIRPTLLDQWVARGLIEMQGCDVGADGSGSRRLYSTERVVQVAITRTLAQLGVAPSIAAVAAARFTNDGNTGRDAGRLYPDGSTWIVLHDAATANVINVPPDASATDLFSGALLGARPEAVALVNLNTVINRVSDALKVKQ